MFRVIDRTLSCLDGLTPGDVPALSRFLALMIELNPGAIELSEAAYRLLPTLPEYPLYVLRLPQAADAAKYPRIAEFICPEEVSPVVDNRIRVEISRDCIDEAIIVDSAERARCRAVDAKLRVVGLGGALCGDYPQMFARLRHPSVEFCPTNRFHCATALAAEWAAGGAGGGVVTAFGGAGGFAATEEVMMILRANNLLDNNKRYDFLPEMARLFEQITKKGVAPNKPIIGKRIFHVESGIHVDGILKQPMCYEPFPPEIVGQARKFVLGRQSGVASIRAKLLEFELRCDEEELPRVLAGVKAKAAENRGAVTDREFLGVVESARSDTVGGINGIDGIDDIDGIDGVTYSVYPTKTSGLLRFARNDGSCEERSDDRHCEERSDEATCLSRRKAIRKATTININPYSTIFNGINNPPTTATPRRYLVDSTLRDGEQTPGIFFSARQKLEIAALLDSSGVHQIEAGVPAASKEEKAAIVRVIENRRNAVISVWSRLVPSDIEHAVDARPDLVHICVPVSQTQIREKLRADNASVVDRLRECLRVVDKSGVPLSVGFEDAFRADIDFMVLIAQILLDSGVTRIRLSDTVGVASPSQCRLLLNEIINKLNGGAAFGIHAHNDLGMAVANTIEAAKSGCLYADVTAGGIGERAGNCNLAQLVRASASIFDWGMTADAARRLQREIGKIIRKNII